MGVEDSPRWTGQTKSAILAAPDTPAVMLASRQSEIGDIGVCDKSSYL